MMETEMNEHLGYSKYERACNENIRNGYKTKKLNSSYGNFQLAAYIVLGVNEDGYKEVLSTEVGENESSKYWLGVLNSLKNRGVKDIIILCSDARWRFIPPKILPIFIFLFT